MWVELCNEEQTKSLDQIGGRECLVERRTESGSGITEEVRVKELTVESSKEGLGQENKGGESPGVAKGNMSS